MPTLKAKLDDLVQGIHRYNEQDDAKQLARPARWHLARTIFGAVMVVKSMALLKNATGLDGFALSGLLFAGGVALIVDGIRILLAQRAKA